MNILILSTHSPKYRAGLGYDVMTALKNAGHSIDFICKIASEPLNHSFTCLLPESRYKRLLRTIIPKRLVKFVKRLIGIKPTSVNDAYPDLIINNGYEIHYLYEDKEGDVMKKLLDQIDKDYDLVITLWWFSMLTSTSLKKIYDKLKCPIMILSIDMAPMTGGCFYFNSCRNFENECLNCPAMIDCGRDKSIAERPRINYLIKRDNYNYMNCAFLGNSWMNSFAKASHLFDNAYIFKIGCIIDEHDFCLADPIHVRNELGLNGKSLILFARSSAEPRKGCDFLIHSVASIWNDMTNQQKIQFAMVTVGDDYIEKGLKMFNIPCVNLGIVNREKLIKLYQASTYFLSPSIDDAGPSMVNQSIMCGCPVVCFDNGTAMDVIKDGISGFKSEAIDQQGFDDALQRAIAYFRTTGFAKIRESSREMAIDTCSEKKFAHDISEIYRVMTIDTQQNN